VGEEEVGGESVGKGVWGGIEVFWRGWGSKSAGNEWRGRGGE